MAISYGYHKPMIQANISTLKNELSAILKKVRKGEEVIILDRNQPVAKISAINNPYPENDAELHAELIRRGIITPAKKKFSKKWFDELEPIKLKNDVDVVELLLQERREGR